MSITNTCKVDIPCGLIYGHLMWCLAELLVNIDTLQYIASWWITTRPSSDSLG